MFKTKENRANTDEENAKIESIKRDERAYRIDRYKIEALPTMAFIVAFALMAYGFNVLFLSAGFGALASLSLSLTVSAFIDIPIAKALKTYAATEARGEAAQRQLNKEREREDAVVAKEYDVEPNRWEKEVSDKKTLNDPYIK